MKKIKLTKDKFAIVDDEYFELLNKLKWYYQNNGYAARSIGGRKNKQMILMHRIILKTPLGSSTDHINGNKLDNRIENLRVCSFSQNAANQRKQSGKTSLFKGVSWSKLHKKWIVQIKKGDKHYFLGLFSNELLAAKKYNESAEVLFGNFAKPNLL